MVVINDMTMWRQPFAIVPSLRNEALLDHLLFLAISKGLETQ